jgi:hypothetical protein
MGFWKWLTTKLSKKESEMARQKKEPVRFTLGGDGIKPNRVGPGRVFNLKAPLQMNIPKDATVTVKLDVVCNYPLHVFEARGLRQRLLRLPDGIWAATDADVELVVQLRNESGQTQLIERGDVVARAFIFDNNDLEVEE